MGAPVGFAALEVSQCLSWLGVLVHTGVYWCTGAVGAMLVLLEECPWQMFGWE